MLLVTSGRKCLDPAGQTAWHPSPHLISVPLVLFQHRCVPGLHGMAQHHAQLVALEDLAKSMDITTMTTNRSIARFRQSIFLQLFRQFDYENYYVILGFI